MRSKTTNYDRHELVPGGSLLNYLRNNGNQLGVKNLLGKEEKKIYLDKILLTHFPNNF